MIIKCIDSTNLINLSKSGSYWEETHKTRVLINNTLECDIITFISSKEGYCKFLNDKNEEINLIEFFGEEGKDRLESMGNDLGTDPFSENDVNEEFDLSELGY